MIIKTLFMLYVYDKTACYFIDNTVDQAVPLNVGDSLEFDHKKMTTTITKKEFGFGPGANIVTLICDSVECDDVEHFTKWLDGCKLGWTFAGPLPLTQLNNY